MGFDPIVAAVIRRILPLALLLLALVPAVAQASSTQESTFQDDNALIYVPRATLQKTLDMLKGLGVDRVRVTLLWKNVAPAPTSRTRPAGFDATRPEAYPVGAWDRYDFLLYEAKARGIEVNFNVTGPAPLWATKPAPRPEIVDTFEPSAQEFGAFVTAAARRFSGTYPDSPYVALENRIPRVSYWSIWNEPNHAGWLTPQWNAESKTAFARAASLYRELLDAAWTALQTTGHGKDTVLIGETAPKGFPTKGIKKYVEALTFVRALYCVDSRLKLLKGKAATALGCASKPSAFRAAHPALFGATGFGHHPYELIFGPTRKPASANWVTLANLGRLTKALDTAFRRYGSKRKLPLYLTEYGYQTNPPDKTGVSFARQAAYLNQAEYIAWKNKRVKTLAQFLLVDDDIKVPAGFQSGLLTRTGKQKPSFGAYRLPLWVTSVRGRTAKVWALLRSAPNGKKATADIQFRAKGGKKWVRVKRVTTRDKRNYLRATVRLPARRGQLRVRYGRFNSRAAAVG
jgi:hypothetical protein